MITAQEEQYILRRAYVPEHSIGLMTRVSGGEPFLHEDYFCCRKRDWLIVVGYPLERHFALREFEASLELIRERFRPASLSLIAPVIPPSLARLCNEWQSDSYYTLNLGDWRMKSGLKRSINRAQRDLFIERGNRMETSHVRLAKEFIERVRPAPRVRELLLRMPQYVGHARGAVMLNALDRSGKLAAFFVVDLAAEDYATYVIGCHSKKIYIPGASDALTHALIRMSREEKKRYIHLGLGVNEGIRRFKEKWGGIPSHPYEMAEFVFRRPSTLHTVLAFMRKS